ncbi:response regulator [Pedobacter polaris]|nr:response regulator [Pedobacter polaris]
MVNKNRIMIVDDNPIDHMITKYVLKHNYAIEDIMVMESAEEALKYLEKHRTQLDALPELIILDLDMPDLNGFDFLERFSSYSDELKNACKIVVLTASDVLLNLEKIKANINVIELINKPLQKDDLLTII